MLGELLGPAEDDALVSECHAELGALAPRLSGLRAQVPPLHDEREAIVVVGSDAQEAESWAEELACRYAGRAERGGRSVRVYTRGHSWFGPRATVMRIGGAGAFGWLAAEAGVHRCDRAADRPVLEAWVEVLPMAVSYDFVRIPDEEVRVEDFPETWGCGARLPDWNRSVRLTHLPTGLVAFCQGQGSTTRNRAGAMTLLQALLLRLRHAADDPPEENRTQGSQAGNETGEGMKRRLESDQT
ncbi:RF-1 domain-containing protein [Thermomonospora echinospora]|uniref:RF-1 domain-containing protein n=1 Tax=Thermomonospora echinospora TaxID=1992 RepID=A0A1H5T4D1_9ACTN|nr:RF-1 domain-containing protein [Thermomonospora echinospora]